MLDSFYRTRWCLISTVACISITLLWHFRVAIYTACAVLFLPFIWSQGSSKFLISLEHDGFDLSFNNYSKFQATAGSDYVNHVPDILHHISLSTATLQLSWQKNRQSCLDLHHGWETHLWTDENAEAFVANKFPYLKAIWDSYRLPIQRIEALKYLVLYEYGGVVLDSDLRCQRSLGPLRRFSFVAPAALPSGLSTRFMMASRQNRFVRSLVQNLRAYNHDWFGLFSYAPTSNAGDLYCSLAHALQHNRSEFRILREANTQFALQSWSGMASTPVFHYLGTFWHSYNSSSLLDAWGENIRWALPVLMVGVFCALFPATHRLCAALSTWRVSSNIHGNDLKMSV